jgi:hypothetical protein
VAHKHTAFRFSSETMEQIDALAERDAPGKPNRTATLTRLISEKYEAAGRPTKARKASARKAAAKKRSA